MNNFVKPNILIFMSDNQSADFLGCYNNEEVCSNSEWN